MLARLGRLLGGGGEGDGDGGAAKPSSPRSPSSRGGEGEDEDGALEEIIAAAPSTPERPRREVPVVATPVPYDPEEDTAPPPAPAPGQEGEVSSEAHVDGGERLARGQAWRALLRVAELRARFHVSVYERLAAVASPHAKNIHKDIRRTFPTHPFYASSPPRRAALHRVVSAYSVYDSVGYSQGMAFVAGFLYMHMSEADAFFSLVQLMTSRRHNLRELYSGRSPQLALMLAEFERQVGLHLPGLAAHLRAEGIDATMYAAPWFLTLFVYRFPVECLPAIWDRFVRHGTRVVFQVGLVVLAHHHDTLMSLGHERLIPFFNALPSVPPEVLRKSRRVRITSLEHVELPSA